MPGSKRYIVSRGIIPVDKYLLVVLMFLIGGMGIAITRSPPQYLLFYGMLGGAIVVIIYSSLKTRRAQDELRRQKRKSKK
jgi:4-hydroxybenzoate polyprenyltransferase